TPAYAAPPTSERAPAKDCVHPAEHADGAGSAARGRDGAKLDHRDMTDAEKDAVEARTDALIAGHPTTPPATTQVPVYIHVMMDRAGNGNVTQEQIDSQIAVLNKTFAGQESPEAAVTAYRFSLAGVYRYYKDNWHADKASKKYRALTRVGGPETLNIWLVDFDYLGIATFPWDYPKDGDIDGIRVLYTSLPGGTETNYNLGETATHEVGHWLGLYHTFDGGCKNRRGGDEVDDTPTQAAPTNGCPEGADTCPKQEGLDPIHNYMDYSYDSCYNQFTAGQSVRMNESWLAYRAP
ncbi:MAG: zinc metalloprotease, partial [Nocardioides sp.]